MVILFIPSTGFLLEVDTTVKEEHTADSKTTKHTVEQGSKITDHIIPEPREVDLEGIVSNTPITQRQYNQAASALQITGSGTTVGKVSGWAEFVFETLVKARDARMLFVVMTDLHTYNDAVLTKCKAVRDAKTGNGLRLTLKFEEIKQVTTGKTVVATKQPKGKPKVTKGTVATQAAPPQSAFGPLGQGTVNQVTRSSGRGYIIPSSTPAPAGH